MTCGTSSPSRKWFNTGPIDEYFEYRFGKLPYRSLQFKHETHDRPKYQTAAVVNYPNDYAYTRITEFKYLTGQEHHKTSIVYEFPQAEGDPYYPIPRAENSALYKQYQQLAEETQGVHFVGRLASYRYYNMDQVVGAALTMFKKLSRGQAAEVVRPDPAAAILVAGNGNGKRDKPAVGV